MHFRCNIHCICESESVSHQLNLQSKRTACERKRENIAILNWISHLFIRFFFRAPSRYLHTDFIERDFSKHFLIFVFGLTTTAKCFSWVYLQLSVCGIVEYRRPTRSEHFQINRFTFVYIYWMKTKVAYKWRYFDPNKNRRRIEVNNWFFVLLVLRPWN